MRPAPDAVLDQLAVISTHASLAGRDLLRALVLGHGRISTHASLAGRDNRIEAARGELARNISTHASLAGRDTSLGIHSPAESIFLPTRPLRDATSASTLSSIPNVFLPTRPLRDATAAR